jgi:hypothetical protein
MGIDTKEDTDVTQSKGCDSRMSRQVFGRCESSRCAERGHGTKRMLVTCHEIRSNPLRKKEHTRKQLYAIRSRRSGSRFHSCDCHGRTSRGVAGHRLLRRGGYVGKRNLTAPSLGVRLDDPSLRPRIGLFWLIPGMAVRGYLIIYLVLL